MEQIPLFDELPEPRDRLFAWPQRHVPEKLRTLAPGQIVFHEGNRSDYIFVVQSGTLKLSKVTEDGRQLILGFPSVGDIVGLSGATDYLNTAETVSTVKLHPIFFRDMDGKLTRDVGADPKLFNRTADQELAGQEHVSLLTMAHTQSRIAAFLLNSARKQSFDKSLSDFVHLPMTQRDIATYLAVAPETYSRTLRKFRDAGILKSQNARVTRGGLRISNIARLRKIVDGENV